MHCRTCKEDIPPKFAHALSVNICPLCGGEIMTMKLKNSLNELRIAFEDAKDDIEEVENWLFSNYSLVKLQPNQIIISKEELDKIKESSLRMPTVPQNKAKPISVKRSAESSVQDKINIKKSIDFINGNDEEIEEDDEDADISDFNDNGPPLSHNEQNAISDLFEDDMQKLRKLQRR